MFLVMGNGFEIDWRPATGEVVVSSFVPLKPGNLGWSKVDADVFRVECPACVEA